MPEHKKIDKSKKSFKLDVSYHKQGTVPNLTAM
jgi:hypothetical protein